MLRELHEATAAASALKADNAEKAKQLQLREDALKSTRADVAKVRGYWYSQCQLDYNPLSEPSPQPSLARHCVAAENCHSMHRGTEVPPGSFVQVHSQKEAALARVKAVEKQKQDMQAQNEELR